MFGRSGDELAVGRIMSGLVRVGEGGQWPEKEWTLARLDLEMGISTAMAVG